MANKRVRVSLDDTNYYTLPGNTAELTGDAALLDDTIFGQDFQSQEVGLISWGVTANAFYKGFAGYVVDLRQVADAATPMADEPMQQVSGLTYQVTDTAKQLLDRNTPIVVKDNAVVVDEADILSIDYLFGKVTFVDDYTPTGPITISGAYFTLTTLAGYRSFTLTQTADAVDNTDIPAAQANGGYLTHEYGLKTVTISLSGIYRVSNGFRDALQSRGEFLVEINPDGNNKSRARGFFKYNQAGQSGQVGDLEEETVSLTLSVPANDKLATPYAWDHANDTTLQQSIRTLLQAWESNTPVYVEYLHDGTNGIKGQGVITDLSLTSGLEAMNEFAVQIMGTGAQTVVGTG